MNTKRNESAEMYLESILVLSEKQAEVRSIDIAHHTGYSKPSVSRAVGLLRKIGHITVAESGQIKLTDSGTSIATKILERHRVLTAFLIALGVSPETASEDACKIEHDLSDESFLRMKEHIRKMYE